MGFCLVNNVVVAARHAQRAGRERVLIIDWDVHHGNGTQALVEADARIRFVSLHQHPWYPGTGMADERGVGNVFNVPRGPAPAGHALCRAICGPRSSQRRPTGTPDLVLDLRRLRRHARRSAWAASPSSPSTTPISPAGCAIGCRVQPIVGLLEGGYTPSRLADGALAHVGALQLSDLRHSVRGLRELNSSAWKPRCLELRTKHPFIIARGGQSDYRTVWVQAHATGTATRDGVRRRRPSSTARPPRRCSPRSTPTAAQLPDGSLRPRGGRAALGGLLLHRNPAARAALSSALHDLVGKRLGVPLLPALGTGPGEGAALHLHHRDRHSRRRCGRRCGRPSSTRSSRSSWGPTGTWRSSGRSARRPTGRSGWTPTAAGP